MHDPMVVAWEVPLPIPRRVSYRDHYVKKPTGIWRKRRTNPENLGDPVYPWYRLEGYQGAVGGKALGLYRVATIWHVEPNGHDSGEVCKHWEDGKPKRAWKWHVHHWHLQIHPLQKARRYIFERCELCGRRYPWGYVPISHQWDRQRDGHWWNITAGAYHHECSSLVTLRLQRGLDEDAIRALAALGRLLEDKTEDDWVNDHLWRGGAGGFDCNVRQRIYVALGYEYDDTEDRLVKKKHVGRIADRRRG